MEWCHNSLETSCLASGSLCHVKFQSLATRCLSYMLHGSLLLPLLMQCCHMESKKFIFITSEAKLLINNEFQKLISKSRLCFASCLYFIQEGFLMKVPEQSLPQQMDGLFFLILLHLYVSGPVGLALRRSRINDVR